MNRTTITLKAQDLKAHREHSLKVDSGCYKTGKTSNFQGMEYGLWCETCQMPVGNGPIRVLFD